MTVPQAMSNPFSIGKPTAILTQSRYEYARDMLRRHGLAGGVVFDVGAGDGCMWAAAVEAGLTWRGFDIEPQREEIAAWDVSLPCPKAERANIALMLDVIEHTRNPWLALRNVADAIEPNGVLILTVPNPRWSRSRIHALLHGYPACFTQADLDDNGHVFTPWPHVMAKLLHDNDLAIEDYVTLDGRTDWPWPPSSLNYPLRLAHAAANKAIEWMDPSACGMSFGMIARRIDR